MAKPISFEVVGSRDIAAELIAYGAKAVEVTDASAKRGALRLSNRIIKLLNKGSRTGIEYKRGGISHTASAAGEPPKSDTGFLASQVRPEIKKTTGSGNVVSASVVISSAYAGFLEEGTEDMAARPFVEPSFELEAPAITNDMAKSIARIK